MPGYLTHVMILIETEKWLRDIASKLKERKEELKKQGKDLSRVETRIMELARQTREYFSYDSSSPPTALPPSAPAEIDNKIGNGISRYAFAGSIGPDIPAGSYIFALNQRWVYNTMHKGSTRRAWVKAGTTEFALNFINNISTISAPELRRPLMSYILGHLSGIATDVVIYPFMNHWVWHKSERNRRQLEFHLDAALAKVYFEREDLHSGQSWTAYFLDDGDEIERLMKSYLEAFEHTYGGNEPLETMCALPPASELKKQFPVLESVILKSYPALENTLARFPGYEPVLKRFPGLKEKLDETEETKKFKDFLDDFECHSAKLDRDFLVDGYKNTVNWAIDQGYDQSRPWLFRIVWALAILGGGALLIKSVWDKTENFSTTFGQKPEEVEAVKQDNLQSWEEHGFFANERMWFDAIDNSNFWSGIFFTVFGMVMTGPPVIPWSGIFGQGITNRPVFPKVYKAIKFVIFTLFKTFLDEFFPRFMNKPEVRWVKLPLGLLADGVGVAITATEGSVFRFKLISSRGIRVATFAPEGSAEKGVEGDRLGAELWKPQYILFLLYLMSCMFAFGVKSGRDNPDGSRETGHNGMDYFLGLIFFPAIGAILVWEGLLDKFLLEKTASLTWTSDETGHIEPFLPIVTDDKGKASFNHAAATGFPVRLFPKDGETLNKAPDGKEYYPEDETAAWADRPEKDEKARSERNRTSAKTDYKLKQLLDRAKYFSGLLAMAAVNYDIVSAEEKERARRVFQDWNLDYRTVDEWDDLMETVGVKPGLLEAAERWWSDIENKKDSDPLVMDRIAQVFGLGSPTHFGQIEDRSAAPHHSAADAKHFLPAGTAFKIVDRDGNVVFTGTTEADGRFNATLPPGDDFVLQIENYQGLKT